MNMSDHDDINVNEEKGLIEVKGVVREILPGFTFRVELEGDKELGGKKFILAKGSGRLRKKRIRVSVLDKVIVEISKHDLAFGRIARRVDDKREDNRPSNTKKKKS